MPATLIERFTADGSYMKVASVGGPPGSLCVLVAATAGGDDEPAVLGVEEAAELGLKVLRWVAEKMPDKGAAALVNISLDRLSRNIGATL